MFKIYKKNAMVEEQYVKELSSSLIICQQSKINSSLTNKTIRLLKTQKNNKINNTVKKRFKTRLMVQN